MPNKPIQQGYKIFALAEHGYIWTFTWSSRLWGIAELFKYASLSPTVLMVLQMIKKLPGLASQPAS
jgi:anaphase-promoting complex subunit 8